MRTLKVYLEVSIEVDDDLTASEISAQFEDNLTPPEKNMLDISLADEVKQGHYIVTDWSLPIPKAHETVSKWAADLKKLLDS